MAKRKSKDTLVIDASIAMAWCFHDEADPYADAIARKVGPIELVVPSIWSLETAMPW